MAEELGTGYIIIQPSTKGLGKAIEGSIDTGTVAGTKKSSKTILQSLGGAFGKVGKLGVTAVTAVGGAVAGLAAKGGFERALNIERAQTKLKALGHDTQSVDAIMSDALASVKGTAFGLGDAASVAASLVASGVKQGDQLTGVLKTVGDTAQIAGTDLTQMGTIFGKVAATGRLQGDEMLQLMEAGIPVLQYLADHYQVTAEEAQKMVSDGKVSFAEFEAAMREHIGGAAQSAGESFDGAMANIKAALSRMGEGFGTPLIKGATQLANQLIPVIDQVGDAIKPLQQQFETLLGNAVDAAGSHIEAFAKALESGETSIEDLMKQVGLLAGGFATLAVVGGNIDPLLGAVNTLANGADNAVAKVSDAFSALPGKLSDHMQSGREMVTRFQGLFDKDIREALKADRAFSDAGQRIADGLTGIKDQFKGGFDRIGNTKLGTAVGKVFDSMKTGIGAGATKVRGAITERMAGLAFSFENNPVVASVKDLGGKVSNGLGALGGKVKDALTPVGNVLGGIGDMVGPKLKGGLDRVGGMLTSFFSPGNIMKFVGIGGIAAALVAGLGMLNESTGGQVEQFASTLLSRLSSLVEQAQAFIAGRLPGLLESGAQLIVTILQGVTSNLPGLASAAGQAISTLLTGLAAAMPQLMPAGIQMVMTLISSLAGQLPTILTAGMTLLQGLIQGIIASLPTLSAEIPKLITTIVAALTVALPQIIEQGATILTSLINGIVDAIPQLVAMLPQIITTIVNVLANNLPMIIQAGVQLLVSLINGLVKALPQLVAYLPQIISSIVTTIAQNLPQIIQAGVEILLMLIQGLIQAIPDLIAAIPQCIQAIKDGFGNIDWGEVGMQIINGIKDGITGAAGRLWDAAKNAASGALDKVKGWLNINSPSRRFRDEVGKPIGEGMAVGITAMEDDVAEAGKALAASAMPTVDYKRTLRASMQDTLRGLDPNIGLSAGVQTATGAVQAARTTNCTYNIYANDPDLVVARIDARQRRVDAAWGGA